MRIEQLEYIVELANHNTFSAAGEKLYITPQALSRAITAMEKEVGCRLISRYAKGMEFTKEGKAFVEMAKRILEDYNRTITGFSHNNDVIATHNEIFGDVYIYSYAQINDSVLGDVLLNFTKNYPNITVYVKEIVTETFIDIFSGDDINKKLYIAIEKAYNSNSESIIDELKLKKYNVPRLNGEYVLCCNLQSPLAALNKVSLKTVFSYPQIFFAKDKKSINPFFIPYFPKRGLDIAFVTTSHIEQINAIKNNAGVSVMFHLGMSEYSASKELYKDIAIVPLKEKLQMNVNIYSASTLSLPTEVFIQFFLHFFN